MSTCTGEPASATAPDIPHLPALTNPSTSSLKWRRTDFFFLKQLFGHGQTKRFEIFFFRILEQGLFLIFKKIKEEEKKASWFN